MQINPINHNSYQVNNTYNKKKISFKSYETEVFKNNKFVYSTYTELFRHDLVASDIERIINKYKNATKINIINHACSAGYESYSLLMSFMKYLGKDFEKFMPIIARDIDKDAIEYAKQGQLKLNHYEYQDACFYKSFKNNFKIEMLNPNISRFNSDIENYYQASLQTDLNKYIDFGVSNIFDDKELISKDNTILICRNFWPFLGDEKISELAFFLANNMKSSSLIMIGDFDYGHGINNLLKSYGFREYDLSDYIYEAPGKSNEVKFINFIHKMQPDLNLIS